MNNASTSSATTFPACWEGLRTRQTQKTIALCVIESHVIDDSAEDSVMTGSDIVPRDPETSLGGTLSKNHISSYSIALMASHSSRNGPMPV